jgi:arginyl-tRNA synthetase
LVDECLRQLGDKALCDEAPMRTVLKLGKANSINEVVVDEQPDDVEFGDDAVESVRTLKDREITTPTLWLRSTKFLDDMDRVLRRNDGRLTYIASDVAYHQDKLTDGTGMRGTGPVDKMITILGPDHHGYIGRLTAVVAALLEKPTESISGGDLSEVDAKIYRSPEERDACLTALAEAREKLEVVIFQIVRFVKEGKPAPMRKRDGNIYALIDLIDELGKTMAPSADQTEQRRIGRDVARFFYLMRSHETHMDFDIDLATKQSDENPVFYAQYAHARVCSVIEKAKEAGFELHPKADTTPLTQPQEMALIKKILDLPFEIKRCAEDYGVHRLTTYAVELARSFHHFYDACRVVQVDQPELTRARLALCEAAKIGLRGTFTVLGISAPDRMDRTA